MSADGFLDQLAKEVNIFSSWANKECLDTSIILAIDFGFSAFLLK
jgi:hypothetical protein